MICVFGEALCVGLCCEGLVSVVFGWVGVGVGEVWSWSGGECVGRRCGVLICVAKCCLVLLCCFASRIV